MLTNIILNLLTGLVALSLTGSVAFHDSRLDTAFIGPDAAAGESASHDYGHAVSHELHVHSVREALSGGDPLRAARSHRKYTALPHARVRLAALTA